MRGALLVALLCACRAPAPPRPAVPPPARAAPTNDPTARWSQRWTAALRWGTVVDASEVPGPSALARIQEAERRVRARGGGVVFLPAGRWVLDGPIVLGDGVVLRGADPVGVTDARQEGYAPPTRLEFPRYRPGAPIDGAFHGIHVADPATTSDVGVVT